MLELLKVNPKYVLWGPYEDYMAKDPEKRGWDAPVIATNWQEFGIKNLDEYNEVVHFYFDLQRDHAVKAANKVIKAEKEAQAVGV